MPNEFGIAERKHLRRSQKRGKFAKNRPSAGAFLPAPLRKSSDYNREYLFINKIAIFAENLIIKYKSLTKRYLTDRKVSKNH